MVLLLKEKYDIDYYNTSTRMQTVLRRPLLILYEFYQSGSFCKTHQKERNVHVSKEFSNFFIQYHQFINQQDIVTNSKKRKLWAMEEFLMYLVSVKVKTVSEIEIYMVDDYINSLSNYSQATLHTIKGIMREALNWNTNTISIVQQKTNNLVVLPLIDEIKLPLIDYIKNDRANSSYSNIFISSYAPHAPLFISTFQRVVNKYMIKAGLDFSNRHHGPHSLRHSLATSLMNNNVPISAISSVLGHASTKTTEIYLTVDEKNLSNLALEVPHV